MLFTLEVTVAKLFIVDKLSKHNIVKNYWILVVEQKLTPSISIF
jgi:hypothetical protein